MTETRCPICFPTANSRGYIAVHVPSGDGTYTVHSQRSVYTDAHDRPCPWQEADHADRVNRLLSGDYTGKADARPSQQAECPHANSHHTPDGDAVCCDCGASL